MPVRGKHLKRIGWPRKLLMVAQDAVRRAEEAGMTSAAILDGLGQVLRDPAAFTEHEHFAGAAEALVAAATAARGPLRAAPAPHSVWGASDLDEETLNQLRNACRLPVTVRGAQMPDGHVGYGLPIGGVVAVRNAVIPYGVGVDIACRMKLSVMLEPAGHLDAHHDELRRSLVEQTSFGIGAEFPKTSRREHPVMSDPAWEDLPRPLADLKDNAWAQLGSSGSGNHFVEFGELVLDREDLGLQPGRYLALLSHSGSRGFGSRIAQHFTGLAMELNPLPHDFRHLAWLEMDTDAGRDYWAAMELAGRYAAANHDLIHRHVLAASGLRPFVQVENHHNFAWLEEHDGETLVVHRKGATPAGEGVLGIIPGSMGTPGYVVRGRGNAASLNSAAHGAGRRMSRSAARRQLRRDVMREALLKAGVELIAGGLDESPHVYKDIDSVMAAQKDLVRPVARFMPRLVLMADEGTSED